MRKKKEKKELSFLGEAAGGAEFQKMASNSSQPLFSRRFYRITIFGISRVITKFQARKPSNIDSNFHEIIMRRSAKNDTIKQTKQDVQNIWIISREVEC